MTLIHTALRCEAQPIIDKYKLAKISPKIYKNDDLTVLISGVGEENTKRELEGFLSSHEVLKAINIGVAGCSDKSIKIGELFCINKKLENINSASITTVKKPTTNVTTTLVDMECSAFIGVCEKNGIECFVLKVVSDYCDAERLEKDFVINLIRRSIKKWAHLI